MNSGEIVAITIATAGMMGTVLLLILNLSLSAAQAKLESTFKEQIGTLQVQIARQETKFANDVAALYKSLSEECMGRDESLRIHQDRDHRLERIERWVETTNKMFRTT